MGNLVSETLPAVGLDVKKWRTEDLVTLISQWVSLCGSVWGITKQEDVASLNSNFGNSLIQYLMKTYTQLPPKILGWMGAWSAHAL